MNCLTEMLGTWPQLRHNVSPERGQVSQTTIVGVRFGLNFSKHEHRGTMIPHPICRSYTSLTYVFVASLLAAFPALADPVAAPAASTPPAATTAATPAAATTPKDQGARFGQALGAVEICFGSKITDKAKALGDAFTGADQDAFKAQAAKIYEAWRAVKNCANQRDPNQCKIIMDKSCATAEAEIGASGSMVAGLVEFMKH
jgi:hypothetical protein